MASICSQTCSTYFLSLAVLAVILLWGVSLWNGTVRELLTAVLSRKFEDGTPLQTNYTDIFIIDFPISLLVAFFFYGTNGSDPGYQLFLVDAYSTLQSAFVWLYVESTRISSKPYPVKNPIIWGLLWQALGGAISLPLYFYCHLSWEAQRNAIAPPATVPALRALPISFAVGALLPAVVGMLPTWVVRSTQAHQRVLAAWQPDPVWVCLAQAAMVWFFSRWPRSQGAGGQGETKQAVRWARFAYAVAALSSASGHIYVLIRIMASNDPLISFSRMYVPYLLTGPVEARLKLASGPWLFLQYDLIIISLSSLSWAYLLVNKNLDSPRQRGSLLLAMLLGALVVGPGATVSLCLFWREWALYERRLLKKARKMASGPY